MLEKLFNPEWQITSNSLLLSSFLIGFSFSPTAEISRLELEVEESLRRKTASIFKKGIGQESNGTANKENEIFLLCQIAPLASSARDLGTRLARALKKPELLSAIASSNSHASFVLSKLPVCIHNSIYAR